MRIIRIDKIRSERRYVYDIEEKELMQFGDPNKFRRDLQNEDSRVIEWLEEETPTFEYEEFDKTGDKIHQTEWVHEDDEL